jgi:hypothetical protein
VFGHWEDVERVPLEVPHFDVRHNQVDNDLEVPQGVTLFRSYRGHPSVSELGVDFDLVNSAGGDRRTPVGS